MWQVEFAWQLSHHDNIRITRRALRAEIARLPPAVMPGTGAARLFNLVLAQSLQAAVGILERDPLRGVKSRGPSPRAHGIWGNGMVVEDKHLPDTISLCVLSCPFRDYFWNAGCPDLTPILCAWDTAWQAEVNASRKPIRVDNLGSLAGGSDRCEFAFRQMTGAG